MPVAIGPGVIQAMTAGNLGVIVSGTRRYGAGIPADSLGNIDDRYTDISTRVIYKKRWVANREGIGTAINNSAGANGTLTDGSPTNFWYAAWVPEP